jgi:hypothetical protein
MNMSDEKSGKRCASHHLLSPVERPVLFRAPWCFYLLYFHIAHRPPCTKNGMHRFDVCEEQHTNNSPQPVKIIEANNSKEGAKE